MSTIEPENINMLNDSPPKIEEKREYPRLQVLWQNEKNQISKEQKVWLVSQEEGKPNQVLNGLVADISRSGVKIIINQENRILDDHFSIVIHPPKEFELPDMEFEGEKRWDNESCTHVFSAAGIRIIGDQSEEKMEQLQSKAEEFSEFKNIKCEIVFSKK